MPDTNKPGGGAGSKPGGPGGTKPGTSRSGTHPGQSGKPKPKG